MEWIAMLETDIRVNITAAVKSTDCGHENSLIDVFLFPDFYSLNSLIDVFLFP